MLNGERQGQRERRGRAGGLAGVQNGAAAGVAREARRVRSLREIVGEVERTTIREALQEFGGNVARAARTLEISRTTLYSKIRDS